MKEDRWITIPELQQLCGAASCRTRLQGLRIMRRQLMQRSILSSYLRLAEKLMADRSENCRWQATIIVGEFISSHPDRVWSILKRHNADTADDAKEMLGTVLLEHLLPVDFDRYFTEIHDRVTAGDEALRDILRYCWNFGVTDSNWEKVRSLTENATQAPARKNAGR